MTLPLVVLIDEIERLPSFGEGQHAILQATEYTHNPRTLETRLLRHGRNDLNRRIFPRQKRDYKR